MANELIDSQRHTQARSPHIPLPGPRPRPSGPDRHPDGALTLEATGNPARTVTILGLSAIGLIHLLDSVGTYSETRWLFWAYVALMASTIIVAGALLHRPHARWFAAAALLAAGPMVGFILSRTTGLPGADDDIGAWTEPLGLASLWVEGAVLATSSYALALLVAIRHPLAPIRPLTVGPLEG